MQPTKRLHQPRQFDVPLHIRRCQLIRRFAAIRIHLELPGQRQVGSRHVLGVALVHQVLLRLRRRPQVTIEQIADLLHRQEPLTRRQQRLHVIIPVPILGRFAEQALARTPAPDVLPHERRQAQLDGPVPHIQIHPERVHHQDVDDRPHHPPRDAPQPQCLRHDVIEIGEFLQRAQAQRLEHPPFQPPFQRELRNGRDHLLRRPRARLDRARVRAGVGAEQPRHHRPPDSRRRRRPRPAPARAAHR